MHKQKIANLIFIGLLATALFAVLILFILGKEKNKHEEVSANHYEKARLESEKSCEGVKYLRNKLDNDGTITYSEIDDLMVRLSEFTEKNGSFYAKAKIMGKPVHCNL